MKRQIIFRYVNSGFPQLYCLKFSFKSVDVSKSYACNIIKVVETASILEADKNSGDAIKDNS